MKNLFLGLVVLITLTITGCDKNEMRIYRPEEPVVTGFDFNLTMEVGTSIIAKYGTQDLKFRIVPLGQEPSTTYKVSFIQFMGTGTVQGENGDFLGQNIDYVLNDRTFKLKYTSHSDTDHFFEVTVKDNFGHIKKKIVKFMPENEVAQGK
ncbi:DUF3872 domain-containing protein [Flavobacterium supellecticarium]|uniref:DUF3872 domain-containing protein n=1 Tax=Flavobacterium supellecticarium TaxID=2565924 RepID=A0A4S4A3K5_9FLAO|nr:TraQ conjugal transfer family protein [Flavobacterium supellecticarium]THF53017.1 DUF3872 domain-containing protein [Flavobacterium supellecticarium]